MDTTFTLFALIGVVLALAALVLIIRSKKLSIRLDLGFGPPCTPDDEQPSEANSEGSDDDWSWR